MADVRSNWWREQGSNNDEGNKEQLLVFGYSCKLFRDDEKATYVDQGNHLIPWMGDKSLTIDRSVLRTFDARGYLHDLKPCEYNSDNVYELSNEEKIVEGLCEEERYLALNKDLDEEAMHHAEEELKRLRAALTEDSTYNEVQFTYDTPVEEVIEKNETRVESDENINLLRLEVNDDKPFVVPAQLNLPSNIFAPRTVKENAIIEKTAAFISCHGTQMEIVLKAKQSANSQFQFLLFDNPLNKYYKYLVECIKDGRYHPKIESQDADDDDYDDDEGYLHPSLLAGNSNSYFQTSTIPYCAYNNQNDDSTYSQLVDKLKDKVVHYLTNETTSQPSSQCQSPVNVSPKQEMTSSSSQSPVIPPEDMQLIIDKMAAYVAKNGVSFEKTVLGKGDSRFDFLKSSHKYNSYYTQRCKHHMLETNPTPKLLSNDKKLKKYVKAPVSFAIKSKDGDGTTLEKNVLSGDESDNVEVDNDQNSNHSTDTAEVPSVQPTTQIEADKAEPKQVIKIESVLYPNVDRFELDLDNAFFCTEISYCKDREYINPFLQPQERLKDKIAAAARERMAQITKEKMLQLERRRKAAVFLNMIKSSGLNIEAKSSVSSTTDSKYEDSSLPTSAITSPVNSPQLSPLRNKEDNEGSGKEISNAHSGIQSTFHSRSKSSSNSRRSESSHNKKSESSSKKRLGSQSKSDPKKYRRSRSRSRSRSSNHKNRSHEKSSRSHTKSKKRSKRSRSPRESKHSKSSRRKHYSSSDSS
ncbi:Splicing factor, suppressor of white-apricot [Nymphon striatum]|nr:Splicing factor, suppressor of white-apricot [Nymphon striatum]